ncbi:MAG: DUF3105 domain-containing protein [Leptospirillum sp.]
MSIGENKADQAWGDSSNTNPTPFPPLFGTAFGGPSSQADQTTQKDPLLKYPSQGHVFVSDPSQCQSFAYSSDPPNSGAMTHEWIPQPQTDLKNISSCTIVHVLSKGNILLFVNPKKLDTETLKAIDRLKGPPKPPAAFLSQEQIGYAVLVITTEKYKDPILLAAWRRLLPLSTWDQIIINGFISNHLGNPHRGE